MKISGSIPIARYAERKERSPKVAIFDSFAERKESPKHGDQVEDIILRTSDLTDRKVQNFENGYELQTSYSDVRDASAKQFKKKLRDYTVEIATGFLNATNQNLQTIISDEKNKIRVINQSQSQCTARVSNPFVTEIYKDEDFRMKMKEVFDLPAGAHKKTVAEALLNEVHGIFERSRHIATARNEYMETAKAAHDKGIAHVVTSGNLGRLTASWESQGIKAPEGAYRSLLAHDYTTIIGATDSRGTITTRDDRAASFTSVYAGAEFAMHGVNVEVVSDDPSKDKFSNGTSFAAPQTTALISEMFDANPNLGVQEMESILFKSTVPVEGTREQVGAGQIDPDRAIFLANQSRFVHGEQFAQMADATSLLTPL